MQEVPYGFCHCGCGQRTRLAIQTNPQFGSVKGKPNRFVHGHHSAAGRESRFVVEDRGYATPCHIWTGTKDANGYGKVQIEGRSVRAHRWTYQRAYGPISDRLELCHKCDVASCVNPEHLFPGSHADNMRDMSAKERAANQAGQQTTVAQALRVLELLECEPSLSVAEVARLVGVGRNIVGAIRSRRGRWAELLPARETRICPECGMRPVDDRRPNAKYCSLECKAEAHRRFCRERNRRNYRLQHGLPL